MTYHTTDSHGVSEISPNAARMREILEAMDPDAEHPDVALVHETGWSLSVYPSGVVTWENLHDDDLPPRYQRNVPKTTALDLWQALARGEIEAIEQLSWQKE